MKEGDNIVLFLSILATIGSITGNIFINFKKKIGFIIWTIANVLWIIVNLIGSVNIPQIIMFSAYSVLNIWGYVKWNKGNNRINNIK